MPRLAAACMVVLVVLAATACGMVPQPFRHGSGPGAVDQPTDDVGVRVEPVEGPPVPMARLLAQSVAEELKEQDVAATAIAGSASRYVLEGRSEANRDNVTVPYIIVIRWTLFDQSGEVVGTHVQGVEGTWWQWQYGDPRIIRAVGKTAAKPIAEMIAERDGGPAGRPEPKTGLLVEGVEGAPGDGNESLDRAIRVALRTAGIALTDDLDEAQFVLAGRVKVGPPVRGQQDVQIVWKMSGAVDGREIGRATQENAVPMNSLDGAWGRVAVLAAAAAIEGIKRMLEPARAAGPSRVTPPPQQQPPPSHQLERVPGRALPPPP